MDNMNFLKTYQSNIMPKIKELDLIMKESVFIIDIDRLSNALSAEKEEIEAILQQIGEPYPTTENVFDIIAKCSSPISKMIMRESLCGSPKSYTSFQIAYIYGLNSRKVQKSFDTLHIRRARPSDLHNIFANIE